MLQGILEGLIKPEVNMEIDTDMSKEINIHINIGTIVITDKELAERIVEAIQRPSEVQENE